MATLYAQSTGNWDAINWNTAANGSGSNQTPSAGDTLVSNSYTVTVNGNYTVTQITNTSGGTFTLANGVTLTCTHATAGILAVGTACVTWALNSPNSATVVANIVGGGSNQRGLTATGSGSLAITGNVTGGSNAAGHGVLIDNACTGTITITGDITGGTNSAAIGVYVYGAANVTITGTTRAANGNAIFFNNTSAVVRLIGAAYASPIIAAIQAAATLMVTGPLIAHANGKLAIEGGSWRWDSSVGATYMEIPTYNLATMRALYTADSVGGNPSAADVRSGTTFGPSNELTGTLAVPPAASVSYGVPVDATTGTAAITAADISAAVWDTLVADLDTADSIGARLAQAATVPSTGAQIAALGV